MQSKPRKEHSLTDTVRQRWHEMHKADFEEFALYTNQELRSMVFDLLGRECNYCGFSDVRALTLDHSVGGGTRERETIGARGIYIKVIKAKGANYQILCANCNSIKRIEEKE